MNKHPLEQELLEEHERVYNLCVNLSYMIIMKSDEKTKKSMDEILGAILKKAAGEKMQIDYMTEVNILPNK